MNEKFKFNLLMPGGNKKVTHLNKHAGLFNYVWPFCYRQALNG